MAWTVSWWGGGVAWCVFLGGVRGGEPPPDVYFSGHYHVPGDSYDAWPTRALALPSKTESINAVLDLVLFELAFPNHCPVCHGRKTFRHGALVVDCTHCGATGRRRITDDDRAAALKLSSGGYRKSREKVLRDWLADAIGELLHDAERQLADALDKGQ